MLVLSRKRDELIRIGEDVIVRVLEVRRDKVRLVIEAPTEVRIHREEIFQAVQTEGAETPERLPAA